GKRPSLGHIKIWGCEVFVRREVQDKLEARSEKCLFVGYPEESSRYLFYKPNDNVVIVARRGVFLEREMISKEDSRKVVTFVKHDDISLPIRKTSGRVSKHPQLYYGFHIEEDKIIDSTLSELDEPATYKEAMASHKAAKWKEAMKNEMQSIYDNQTDMDRKVYTYKARLAAKGYTQTHGIDYRETFSPVAKIKSIRIMLAIAAFHDYEIWQIDVKNAFLNGKLTKDVFVGQQEGPIRYAITCTRPDVSFALSMLSRHQQNPSEDKDDSRSHSGWVFLLNEGAVRWKSLKQDIVIDFTCESEYIAACEASKEAIWMKNFIGDLGVVPTVQDPRNIL
nr:hypothetical protein [Tanacetum cinerariifolium]